MTERLRPAVVCPKCGQSPAFVLYETTVYIYADLAPYVPVINYTCQTRGCNHWFDVPARAFQQAKRKVA